MARVRAEQLIDQLCEATSVSEAREQPINVQSINYSINPALMSKYRAVHIGYDFRKGAGYAIGASGAEPDRVLRKRAEGFAKAVTKILSVTSFIEPGKYGGYVVWFDID